jgi:hypothetical protein
MAPRSSAMMKQITLHRTIRERVRDVSSSSEEEDDDDDDYDDEEEEEDFEDKNEKKETEKEQISVTEAALERRLSTVENNPGEAGRRKQSLVGGKVIVAEDLPWKSGNPDGSCTLRDVDMIFVSNCMTGQKGEINNKRTLLRFQFLDCIVAMACIKYLNSGICKSISLAIDMFIGNNIGRLASKRNDSRFIDVILPSKPIDMVLKFHLGGLKQSFAKISTPSDFNSNVRTVSLSKWIKLCDISDINMGERSYKHCFIFSKMQGILDLFNPAYCPKELQFVEFVEAIARIAYMKQTCAVEQGLRKAPGTLSNDELNMHVTVATVCEVLKEILKSCIKQSAKVQDTS